MKTKDQTPINEVDSKGSYHMEALGNYSTSRPATLEEILKLSAVKKHIAKEKKLSKAQGFSEGISKAIDIIDAQMGHFTYVKRERYTTTQLANLWEKLVTLLKEGKDV